MVTAHSLTRQFRCHVNGGGYGRSTREERERARDFLGGRMMMPGPGNLLGHVERELDEMTPAERVYLEIEMAEKFKAAHSWNYNPSAWGRK
jgi:hypothetical protein